MKSSNLLHVGCAAATTIAGWLNVILLIIGLRRKGYLEFADHFWSKIIKMLIASVVMGCVIWFSADFLRQPLYEGIRLLRFAILMLVVSTGIVSYFLVAHVIGAAKLSEIKAGFRR